MKKISELPQTKILDVVFAQPKNITLGDFLIANTSKDEVLKRLKEIVAEDGFGDREKNHIESDDLLLKLLSELGLNDIVDEFKKIEKWHSQSTPNTRFHGISIIKS